MLCTCSFLLASQHPHAYKLICTLATLIESWGVVHSSMLRPAAARPIDRIPKWVTINIYITWMHDILGRAWGIVHMNNVDWEVACTRLSSEIMCITAQPRVTECQHKSKHMHSYMRNTSKSYNVQHIQEVWVWLDEEV